MVEVINYQDEAYSAIKKMILSLELLPGSKVNKNDLAQTLDVGVTPLREAIIRLQREGLFDVIAQRGTYVSKINLDEVYQARFVRENIEKLVCQEAAALASPSQLLDLKKILQLQKVYLQSNDYENFFALDEDFHRLFYTIARKEFIWRWLQPLNLQFDRFRFLRLEVKSLNWDKIIEQHTQIVHYTEQNDAPALEAIVIKHLHMVDEDTRIVTETFPDYFK
ncbi:GntR family transcriptional regulator [Lapidilactobacillus luobeiensis]|uniref:GntR family transcriptional regulator n=1 Tax=Lapidilactobacillus luobeiensis TaxID=2950371 RepID=UPI0021C30CFD|nr:GntR family transcriptional regulator [Lapidilactobacillus luobeiensis]